MSTYVGWARFLAYNLIIKCLLQEREDRQSPGRKQYKACVRRKRKRSGNQPKILQRSMPPSCNNRFQGHFLGENL